MGYNHSHERGVCHRETMDEHATLEAKAFRTDRVVTSLDCFNLLIGLETGDKSDRERDEGSPWQQALALAWGPYMDFSTCYRLGFSLEDVAEHYMNLWAVEGAIDLTGGRHTPWRLRLRDATWDFRWFLDKANRPPYASWPS